MDYKSLLSGIERYGTSTDDICRSIFGINLDQIKERVVIAPWWEPSVFSDFGKEIVCLSSSESATIKVWDITTDTFDFTYIKTGIGAPVLMDVILALGITACKKAIFVGSVGSLDNSINIGDIVLPEYSICGDGASRYLTGSLLKSRDVFGEKCYPDSDGFVKLKAVTEKICEENGVKWHIGKNFSIDTIFAQFFHIDEIVEMGCNVIEMETAAAFRAASLTGISMNALFSVSDNTVKKKSLLSGRSEKEMDYRSKVRSIIFPRILLEYLT